MAIQKGLCWVRVQASRRRLKEKLQIEPKKNICWTTAVRLSIQPQSLLSLYLALFRILRCSCVASEQQETEVLGHERLRDAAACCLSLYLCVCVLFWDSFSAYKSIKTQSRVNLQLWLSTEYRAQQTLSTKHSFIKSFAMCSLLTHLNNFIHGWHFMNMFCTRLCRDMYHFKKVNYLFTKTK